MMKIIGLSGGICSGKSIITEICQTLGGYIINADILGHQAYLPGTECYQDLIQAFGSDIINPDASINRKMLGSIVFADESKLKLLNSLVWPRIRNMIEVELNRLREIGEVKAVVIEAAILIEAGWNDLVDEVWVIDVDRTLAIERLMNRNGFSREECEKRIASQLPSEERVKYATRVIHNSGTREELESIIRSCWNEAIIENNNI